MLKSIEVWVNIAVMRPCTLRNRPTGNVAILHCKFVHQDVALLTSLQTFMRAPCDLRSMAPFFSNHGSSQLLILVAIIKEIENVATRLHQSEGVCSFCSRYMHQNL